MTEILHTGNPIWVYYTDVDSGTNLQVPRLLRGRLALHLRCGHPKFPAINFLRRPVP